MLFQKSDRYGRQWRKVHRVTSAKFVVCAKVGVATAGPSDRCSAALSATRFTAVAASCLVCLRGSAADIDRNLRPPESGTTSTFVCHQAKLRKKGSRGSHLAFPARVTPVWRYMRTGTRSSRSVDRTIHSERGIQALRPFGSWSHE